MLIDSVSSSGKQVLSWESGVFGGGVREKVVEDDELTSIMDNATRTLHTTLESYQRPLRQRHRRSFSTTSHQSV